MGAESGLEKETNREKERDETMKIMVKKDRERKTIKEEVVEKKGRGNEGNEENVVGKNDKHG